MALGAGHMHGTCKVRDGAVFYQQQKSHPTPMKVIWWTTITALINLLLFFDTNNLIESKIISDKLGKYAVKKGTI